MKRSARHSEAIVVDLDAAARMLEHTCDQWSHEHHAIVEGMLHALVEMTRQLHAQGASLARLRRLWGIHTTEKLSAVFWRFARAAAWSSRPARGTCSR